MQREEQGGPLNICCMTDVKTDRTEQMNLQLIS